MNIQCDRSIVDLKPLFYVQKNIVFPTNLLLDEWSILYHSRYLWVYIVVYNEYFHNPPRFKHSHFRQLLFSALFCFSYRVTEYRHFPSRRETWRWDLSKTNLTLTVIGHSNEIWDVIDVHELFTECLINTFNQSWVSENRQVPPDSCLDVKLA